VTVTLQARNGAAALAGSKHEHVCGEPERSSEVPPCSGRADGMEYAAGIAVHLQPDRYIPVSLTGWRSAFTLHYHAIEGECKMEWRIFL